MQQVELKVVVSSAAAGASAGLQPPWGPAIELTQQFRAVQETDLKGSSKNK